MSSQEEKYRNYYEILELEENATLADINRAYKKLTELYSTESIVTDPILDEFGEDEREEIVNQIEEAYKALILYVVQKDRAQKLPGEEEQKPEDTTEEEKEAIAEEPPEPAKEISEISEKSEISDVIAKTKEEIDEEEEVLLLDEVLPDEESIKTMIAPPTATFPTSASASPMRPAPSGPSAPSASPVPPEPEEQEIPMDLAKAKTPVESLEPFEPLESVESVESVESLESVEPVARAVPDFPEELEPELEAATIHIHENDQDHEPIHIELPDKEEEFQDQDNGFEILDSDEEEEPVMEDLEEKYKIPARKGIWDESLFEKDIDSIKKEITRDLTKDIQEQLTFTREPSTIAEESQVMDQAEGILIKGRTLRKLREKLGMGIHEMAVSTKIHYKILVNIEKERFAKLPEPGYLRWYLMTYAKRLSLDPKRVADEYMKRYRQWEKEQKSLA